MALLMLVVGDLWAQPILSDDFNDGNDDGWIHSSTGGGGRPIFDASSGAYNLATSNDVAVGALGGVLSFWRESRDDRYSNGFLRAKVKANTLGTTVGLVLRGNGSYGNGYYFVGSTKGGNFRTFKCVSYNCGSFRYTDVPFAPGEEWFLEAGALEDELTMKVWRVGEDEPTSPQLIFYDTSLPSGMIGVEAHISTAYNALAITDGTFDDIYFTVSAPLQAGDADQDFDFDQLDLVKVQVESKYLTGDPATWGEGDWNGAPGGSPGNPPAGNGRFDQLDIIAALAPGHYLSGPYAAVRKGGHRGDGQTSISYDAGRGEMAVDAPAGVELTSINIDSAGGIFTGNAAQNLGGSFDNDADNNIFKATFGSSFGSLSFGDVAQPGLAEEFLVGDLTVVGSLAGGGALGEVDLIYVPEPATCWLLLAAALACAAGCAVNRRWRSQWHG
jgi:hypothetical protein